MLNNVALDVFIGLIFVFLLYSLLATILQEIIATRFSFRAKVLEKAILRMLEDGRTTTKLPCGDRIIGIFHLFGFVNMLKGKKIAPWFYAHPLIQYLAEDNYYSKPGYLSAQNFSKVLLDLLKGFGYPESQAIQTIHNSIIDGRIYKLPINLAAENSDETEPPNKSNPAIKVLQQQEARNISNDLLQFETIKINKNTALYIKSLWIDSGADVEEFRKKIEKWFDDTMERTTGWYKRYTRFVLFLIGFLLAVSFNVDTIAIHRILSKDKDAREKLVQMAIQSQNKQSNDVSRQEEGKNVSDSILLQTYQTVAEDANKANSILGLGRVWTDTCKLCEELNIITDCSAQNDTSKMSIINDSLNLSVKSINDSVSYYNNRLNELRHLRDSLSITLTLNLQQRSLKLLKSNEVIKKDSVRLRELLNSPELKKKEEMEFLAGRCFYIKTKIDGKWWIYAPNQTGGIETLLGWLITALAIMLGAPFWFDLLGKLIKIRGSGTNPDITGTPSSSLKAAAETAPVTVYVNPNSGDDAVG